MDEEAKGGWIARWVRGWFRGWCYGGLGKFWEIVVEGRKGGEVAGLGLFHLKKLNVEIHEAYVGDSGIEGQKACHEVVVIIREVERKDEGSGSMAVRGEGGDEDI